jgi:hypothetical protein
MIWMRYPHSTLSHQKAQNHGTKWHQKRHQISSQMLRIYDPMCAVPDTLITRMRSLTAKQAHPTEARYGWYPSAIHWAKRSMRV